jgi:haloalkane dehalogenase
MIAHLNAHSRPAWLDPQLYPFASHYVEIEGCDIHYVDEGDGPALLLLHSHGMWSFTYRHLIRALRDRFRCIALDFPGFGLSSAPREFRHTVSNYSTLLDGFVQELDLRDMVLLAHDAGGPIGLGTVVRHAAWFRGVILLDTFCFPLNKDRFLSGMLRLVSSRFPGVLLVD